MLAIRSCNLETIYTKYLYPELLRLYDLYITLNL